MKKVLSKDGTLIAYELIGKGPILLLIDGAMAYREHRGSRPLALELSDSFTIVTYDRRGRGESSDTNPYSVQKEIDDIEAIIKETGSPVNLYGFSSGSVLALLAAATLGSRISKLAMLEPPFSEDTDASKKEFAEYSNHMKKLISTGEYSEAVSFFLSDMIPADILEHIKQSPDWKLMEQVAPTLSYDNEILGNGSVPIQSAAKVNIPTLVLVGAESPAFKHTAAADLTKGLSKANLQVIEGQSTLIEPAILAPILKTFFQNN